MNVGKYDTFLSSKNVHQTCFQFKCAISNHKGCISEYVKFKERKKERNDFRAEIKIFTCE